MDNYSLLHLTSDIEGTQPQALMSISNEVRGMVATGNQANGLCPVLFPRTTAGPTLMSPLNLRDELDRLMQARTNFQYRFGMPADAAVHVKETPVDHSMPVLEAETANRAWIGRREFLSASAMDHGRGRCKSVRAPTPNHARAMARH